MFISNIRGGREGLRAFSSWVYKIELKRLVEKLEKQLNEQKQKEKS